MKDTMTIGSAVSTALIRHVPDDDKERLAGVGSVVLYHAHLDYSLIGAIKTLARLDMADARKKYRRTHSRTLREHVGKHARHALGADSTEVQLIDDFLNRCEKATDLRNRYVHAIWYRDHATDELGLFYDEETKELPTVKELADLSDTINRLANEINSARNGGYIQAAMLGSAP